MEVTTTPEEMRYYHNLLILNVGDTVEWCMRPHARTRFIRGTIESIYSDGINQHRGMAHAFINVRVKTTRCSVSLLNPTLKKLETDK